MAEAGEAWAIAAWPKWVAHAKAQNDRNGVSANLATDQLFVYKKAMDEARLALIAGSLAFSVAAYGATVTSVLQGEKLFERAVAEASAKAHIAELEKGFEQNFKQVEDWRTDRLKPEKLRAIRPERAVTFVEYAWNFSNGVLDGLSANATGALRKWVGGLWAYSVDTNSVFYQVGQITGTVAMTIGSGFAGGACGVAIGYQIFNADAFAQTRACEIT